MERIFSALKVSVVSDDVSDLKIIDKLVLKLSKAFDDVSTSVTEIWCIATKLLNYEVF